MEDPLVGDSLFYRQFAQQLLRGDLSETYWPPGLPMYEAAWMWLFGDSEAVLRLSMLPWFVVLVRGTYNFFHRIHGRPAANLAVLGLVIFPDMVHHSIEPLSHLPTAACLMFAFNQTLAHARHERTKLIGLGLVLGYLSLLRPASAIFILLIPAWMFMQRRRTLPPTLVGTVASLVVAGWIYLLFVQHGRFIPVNESNARNFYLGNNAWTPAYKTWYLGSHWEGEPEVPEGFRQQLHAIQTLPRQEQSGAFSDAAWQHIKANPGSFGVRSLSRIRTFFAFDTFTGARLVRHHGYATWGYGVLAFNAVFITVVFWLAACMLMRVWRRDLGGSLVLLMGGATLAYALPYWFAFSHPTYHLALLPLLFGLAAIPLARIIVPLGDPLGLPSGRSRLKIILIGVLILAIQVEWVYHMMP